MGVSIEPKPKQITDFIKGDVDGPIVMINLLKFKPDGGRESYQKYGELAAPHIVKAGAKIVYHGSGKATIIGDDGWDSVLLVEYASKQDFFDMVTDPEYVKLSKHRTDALLDSRLYCTQRDVVPG